MESKRKGAQLQIGYGGDYTYKNISVVAVGALLRKYQERLLQMGNGDYTYIYTISVGVIGASLRKYV